nr:hypothetical protein [Acinetobacter tandoii]
MKLNINFDWAVVTSVFTFLLYWCGYCYYTGYLDFYNINIDSFDIPLVSMIIQGFITGYHAWLALIIIFIILSYVTSISSVQWKYWLIKGIGLTLNFLIIIFHLTLYYPIRYIRQRSLVSRAITFTKEKTPNKIKLLILSVWRLVKNLGCIISNKSKRIEASNHKILTHLNLTTPQIKQEVYGENPESSASQNFAFDLSFFIHYSVLLLLLFGIVRTLNVGQSLIDDGKSQAHKHFTTTLMNTQNEHFSKSSYPRVIIKNSKSTENLFLTNVCLKSLCLVTDGNRTAQLFEVKDLKIINESK